MTVAVVCDLLTQKLFTYSKTAMKILLASDRPDDRHFFPQPLIAAGFDVLCARDGNHAIAVAEVHVPDLLICRMLMPGRSAFLILEHLACNLDKPLPAIVVAKYANWGKRHERMLRMLGATVVGDDIGAHELIEEIIALMDDDTALKKTIS